MKILVTNDDGVNARGLWALVEALRGENEVVVVAPDREQSGVGASVTLHHPLRVNTVSPQIPGIETYAVEGTPADCIILALGTLIKGGVDLVFSGINHGANLGNDMLISGTVGAVFQAHFLGLPSIALSVVGLVDTHLEVAAQLAPLLARQVAGGALPPQVLLNINLPNLPREQIRGIEITHLGRRGYADVINEGHDGKRKYYWIVRGKPEWDISEGTDAWAVDAGKISITPLQSDFTSGHSLIPLRSLCSALFPHLNSCSQASS